jgi:hypothetical protein
MANSNPGNDLDNENDVIDKDDENDKDYQDDQDDQDDVVEEYVLDDKDHHSTCGNDSVGKFEDEGKETRREAMTNRW